ncbi:retrotransposon protein, putative, ty1-copia subclass [Tanacetum coccineum]|uniref:Retrotransposon protein, putative, ty1-copia subclass n=1 Tax=Tanacetum coccineum TaxID=301880 RepID=A0ABQ5J4G5_9ASTR
MFKTFKNEVENQLGKTIKALRSDRGGEYLSQEFLDHLRSRGIISQLTPPYMPQHNGVSERRNQSLLDMVRSMMSLTTLPMSFWCYALKFAARILNMVLTKKVNKTPYEMWHGKVLNLSYLKVWGCEALVKRDMPNKIESRSIKCIFVGYPKKTMGYCFYYPLENKVFVARYVEFFETSLITQEATHLVAKGFTQTYGVDYEETFSPVADIKAIRILIAIVAYYDYEIWQMDVKTAFLNGRLNEDVYMVQLEGFMNPKYPRQVCKLQRSIYGCKQASRSWNKRFDEEIKSKSQGPSTPTEVKRMKGIPYASAVGSIMYVVRCTRPDVAFSHNLTSRYQQNPGKSHWTAVKNILKYLRNTKDMFLVYSGDPTTELSITCYTNASWETDRDDLRSQRAEYIVAAEAAMEAIWIRKFIYGLGVVPNIDKPMDMYCDNTCAITIADEPSV